MLQQSHACASLCLSAMGPCGASAAFRVATAAGAAGPCTLPSVVGMSMPVGKQLPSQKRYGACPWGTLLQAHLQTLLSVLLAPTLMNRGQCWT